MKTTAELRTFIDKLAAVGLPLYITEYDINEADDAKQKQIMSEQFPLFWNDDRIKGITLWGLRSRSNLKTQHRASTQRHGSSGDDLVERVPHGAGRSVAVCVAALGSFAVCSIHRRPRSWFSTLCLVLGLGCVVCTPELPAQNCQESSGCHGECRTGDVGAPAAAAGTRSLRRGSAQSCVRRGQRGGLRSPPKPARCQQSAHSKPTARQWSHAPSPSQCFSSNARNMATTASKEAVTLRSYLDKTEYSWRAVSELREQLKDRKARGSRSVSSRRLLVLREPQSGVCARESSQTNRRLRVGQTWIQRGALVMQARRDVNEGYVCLDGPETGTRVRLLHLDRLGDGEVPKVALHRDFRLLRGQLYFEQAQIRHVTASTIIADLRYGELWVPTLLGNDGATLTVVAEAVAPELVDVLALTRDRLRRKLLAVSVLRQAMQAMISEALPFDEPKTEVGQEDGKLRPEWEAAYKSGRTLYTYNEDQYPVFDRLGRARVPQVCIDFMIDTFERAGGSWWQPRAAKVRERTPGRLDLSDLSRSRLRQTAYLRELAAERSDLFEVRDFAESERIELGYKDTFFAWLTKNVREFEAGDMIIIRGLTPWDEVEQHTHSFFVYETDPISGVPIAIAGNAGPANLWSWETEARRTPKRTVRARIRPKLEWLETFIDVSSKEPVVPAPLLAGKK